MDSLLSALSRGIFGDGSGHSTSSTEPPTRVAAQSSETRTSAIVSRSDSAAEEHTRTCLILYASQSGTAAGFAQQLAQSMNTRQSEVSSVRVKTTLASLGDVEDPESLLIPATKSASKAPLLVFLVVSKLTASASVHTQHVAK